MPDDDRIPDGRLHAKLVDPEWQAMFRLCVGAALRFQRDFLESLLVSSSNRVEAYSWANATLRQLRLFLVDSAVDAAPYGIYAGRDPHVKDAYEATCRMFAIGTRKETESGREAFPIKSLAWIDAKLNGGDVVKAAKDADELIKMVASSAAAEVALLDRKILRPNAERDKWLYDQYVNSNKKTLAAIRSEAKLTKGWIVDSDQALRKGVQSHCDFIGIKMPTRNKKRTKPD